MTVLSESLTRSRRKSAMERFMEKVSPEPTTGCWLWTGHVNGMGYAKFHYEGKVRSGHRFAWTTTKGPIPPGMCVCHTCDNGVIGCVNPDHLFLGTPADNVHDMHAKGRDRNGQSEKTHCPKGHEYTPANTRFSARAQGGVSRHCNACHRISNANRKLVKLTPVNPMEAA